jgi:glycosyltransferase involved in cell wall biosynthesis
MPHKNFNRLLLAWKLIPKADRPKLVITGSHGDDPLAPLVRALELDDDVELLSWVGDDRLSELYEGASLYVLPSLFEGFGLPVLEAMARGCAVVASDLPVLREVGGDACVYVDPLDPAAVASGVRRVLGDQAVETLRVALLGEERAEQPHASSQIVAKVGSGHPPNVTLRSLCVARGGRTRCEPGRRGLGLRMSRS